MWSNDVKKGKLVGKPEFKFTLLEMEHHLTSILLSFSKYKELFEFHSNVAIDEDEFFNEDECKNLIMEELSLKDCVNLEHLSSLVEFEKSLNKSSSLAFLTGETIFRKKSLPLYKLFSQRNDIEDGRFEKLVDEQILALTSEFKQNYDKQTFLEKLSEDQGPISSYKEAVTILGGPKKALNRLLSLIIFGQSESSGKRKTETFKDIFDLYQMDDQGCISKAQKEYISDILADIRHLPTKPNYGDKLQFEDIVYISPESEKEVKKLTTKKTEKSKPD